MTLMRSANCTFSTDSGSRDSGAPARAASRCQAKASAILSLGSASSAWALAAHSAPITSWPLARLISSSFSRSGLAAPLSRTLSSLKTSCTCSGVGLPASHSRTRDARSPEVAAEKAPPVSASSGWTSWTLGGVAGTSGVSDILLREGKGNMKTHKYVEWHRPKWFVAGPLKRGRSAPDSTPCACQHCRYFRRVLASPRKLPVGSTVWTGSARPKG